MHQWVELSEILRNFCLMLAGAIGLYIGWKRVKAANSQAEAQVRQADLTRRDHVAELFNRAIGQLTDDKLEVRLGAIYTLEQVCADFDDLAVPVLRLLTTYLRENRLDYGDVGPPVDVQEITRILSERLREGL